MSLPRLLTEGRHGNARQSRRYAGGKAIAPGDVGQDVAERRVMPALLAPQANGAGEVGRPGAQRDLIGRASVLDLVHLEAAFTERPGVTSLPCFQPSAKVSTAPGGARPPSVSSRTMSSWSASSPVMLVTTQIDRVHLGRDKGFIHDAEGALSHLDRRAAVLSRRSLERGVFTSTADLEQAIHS